jgi:hypothetical protein
MDGTWFDHLTRDVGGAATRRAALRILAAAAAGALAAARGGQRATEAAQRPPATTDTATTHLTVTNNSGAVVQVYLTLGSVAGCARNVTLNDVPFVTNRVNQSQGWFNVAPHDSVTYTAPSDTCMSGNFSFGGPPQNCPDRGQFPNGMNLAEFTLNNGTQGANAQETVDISGVYGVNAHLQFQLSGGGPWNDGAGQRTITGFENQGLLQNIGLSGVFPYGCDDCTRRTSPTVTCPGPNVPPFPNMCDATHICNVQRDAATAGGTVQVIFNGFM